MHVRHAYTQLADTYDVFILWPTRLTWFYGKPILLHQTSFSDSISAGTFTNYCMEQIFRRN
jgi:hypothetical protein